MIVPDSSVLVAGFVVEHDFHDVAKSAVADVLAEGCLAAHTTAETYAVLSSPGGPFRFDPEIVVAYLDDFLEGSAPVHPRPHAYKEALELLSSMGRGGACVYDALIALTARDANATLISLDRRAEMTYELCGVDTRMLAG